MTAAQQRRRNQQIDTVDRLQSDCFSEFQKM